MAQDNSSDKATLQGQGVPEGAVAVPPKGGKGSNKLLVIILIVLVVFFVLPAIGLFIFFGWLSRGDNVARLTETAIEQATGNAVDITTEDGFSISDGNRSLQIGGEQLPDNFPQEVVLYSNQTVTAAYSQSDAGSESWYVAAQTNDTIEQFEAYLQNEFADWTQESSDAFEQTRSYTYAKDTFSVTITTFVQDGSIQITYTVTRSTAA
jgi:hypothetical protein